MTKTKPPLWLAISLVVFLGFSVVMAYAHGDALSPTQRQITLLFLALFASVVLFFGGSAANVGGTFRGLDLKLVGPVAAGFAFYLLLSYTVPSPEERPVGLTLWFRKGLLAEPFSYTLSLPGRTPLNGKGDHGVALVVLPSRLREIDSVTVTCPGYSLGEAGPYRIEGGSDNAVARLPMVDDNPAPLPPWAFSENAIPAPDWPTKEEVRKEPKYPPEIINFKYKNSTEDRLNLMIFSFSRHYADPEGRGGFVAGKRSPWSVLAFPPGRRFENYSQFRNGTGWFAFFVVGAGSDSDVGPRYYLGVRNLFATRSTSLVVTKTGDSRQPYRAEFMGEDQ